jgi:hypothetical protein
MIAGPWNKQIFTTGWDLGICGKNRTHCYVRRDPVFIWLSGDFPDFTIGSKIREKFIGMPSLQYNPHWANDKVYNDPSYSMCPVIEY